jgi:hypothetical protein
LSVYFEGKNYVRAIADYITNEPNLLSFKAGDIIQLIRRDQRTPIAPFASNVQWLYGRIDNRYGNLPADYVESVDNRSSSAV